MDLQRLCALKSDRFYMCFFRASRKGIDMMTMNLKDKLAQRQAWLMQNANADVNKWLVQQTMSTLHDLMDVQICLKYML